MKKTATELCTLATETLQQLAAGDPTDMHLAALQLAEGVLDQLDIHQLGIDTHVDRILLAVCQLHDGPALWEHTRRDPAAFRNAVREAMRCRVCGGGMLGAGYRCTGCGRIGPTHTPK